MGKIITEKDFWTCSMGNVPAQLQGPEPSKGYGVKKQSGELYITKDDKATSSWIDFGCKKYMMLMAAAAAIAVVALAVVGVLTVATGGAALIAVGAIAGLAGAALGAIVGGLLCGQKAAALREWTGSKPDLIIHQRNAITSDHKMICSVGGTIEIAPNIKNWKQAIALGSANYIQGLLEGMTRGAFIGMGGGALSGGVGAFAAGGLRGLGSAGLNFLKAAPGYVGRNFAKGVFLDWGKKSAEGGENFLRTYGEEGSAGVGDFAGGIKKSALGDVDAVKNIFTGNCSWSDVQSLALLFAPVSGGKRKSSASDSATQSHKGNKPKAETDGNTKPKEVDNASKKSSSLNSSKPSQKGKGEAFESKPVDPPNTYRDRNGRLRDDKTHRFVKDPNTKQKSASKADPPNTFRDKNGRLHDKTTGRFVKDPKVKGNKKNRYRRSMAERRKTLMRDKDKLDPEARKYIEKNNGRKVPNKKYNKDYDGSVDYVVHHKKPLYTETSIDGKRALDKSPNMETIPSQKHVETHSTCGPTYHRYPRG
ncbi:PAAR-like protein [Sinomicrobium sp.]